MIIKVNFYLRIFDKFGLLVNLINTCLKDIVPFMTYLMIWVISFVMMYAQVRIISPKRTYTTKYKNFARFLYVWENSMGNLQYPGLDSFETMSPELFYLTMFIWWTNQFFVVVILLNFLIAVIS